MCAGQRKTSVNCYIGPPFCLGTLVPIDQTITEQIDAPEARQLHGLPCAGAQRCGFLAFVGVAARFAVAEIDVCRPVVLDGERGSPADVTAGVGEVWPEIAGHRTDQQCDGRM